MMSNDYSKVHSASARALTLEFAAQPCLIFASAKYRISGLVVEYIVAIDVARVRFPADATL